MNPRPKTIQIFLPSGDPRGIRIANITTQIAQVIEVPRSLLSEFLERPESGNVAVYFLLGGSEDGDDLRSYVGQSGDLVSRLAIHNRDKDFWERVLVLISQTGNLTQTHAQFLEQHCMEQVEDAGRYSLENTNRGTKPHLQAPQIIDCLDFFETASTLLATLGYPLFLPVKPSDETAEDNERFYCKQSGADGQGIYTQEGFVVLEGSSGRAENQLSLEGTKPERVRQQLLESGVTSVQDEKMVFEKDHLFNSPSLAASVLIGSHANGWTSWVNKAEKTLHQVKR